MVQWIVNNVWSDTLYMVSFFVENPGNSVLTPSFLTQSASVSSDFTPTSSSSASAQSKMFTIIVYLLLLVNVVMFAAKIVIELSLSINKLMNVVEGCHLALLLGAVFAKFTNLGIVLKENKDGGNYFKVVHTQAELQEY